MAETTRSKLIVMQLVPSITRYTCALACLESYSRDIGLSFTQADLMKYYPMLCLDTSKPHEFGAVSFPQLIQLCSSLALNPQHWHDFDFTHIEPILKSIDQNQTVLFSVLDYRRSGCSHVVRFGSIVGGQKLRVMCPCFMAARFEDIDWQDLVAGDVTTIQLTRKSI
jgi:hypothetical protein